MIRIASLIAALFAGVMMFHYAHNDRVGLTIAYATLMVLNHNTLRTATGNDRVTIDHVFIR